MVSFILLDFQVTKIKHKVPFTEIPYFFRSIVNAYHIQNHVNPIFFIKKGAGNINLESVKSKSLFFLLHTMSSKFLFNISLIK